MKQTTFSFIRQYKKQFGGSLLIGKRKERRPLSTKHPIHLFLKTNQKGVFAPTNRSLQKLNSEMAKRFNVTIYETAINWSHLHLIVRTYRRVDYIKFIRALSSILAQKIRRAKGVTKVFELRPFTRILNWGRDFQNALNYQILNQMEAVGFIKRPQSKRKRQYSPLTP